jgi:hypothetical protein
MKISKKSGLNLYQIKSKTINELSRINHLLKTPNWFEEIQDWRDYRKYAIERKSTLKGMIILINKELGYKDKGQRDRILDNHLLKLKKIRGKLYT